MPCLARNHVLGGQYKVLTSSLSSWSYRPTQRHCSQKSPAAFSCIHTSVRGQQVTSLKAQFSSPPNTSSACCNYTGGTAALPTVHGKFQWSCQHLPTQMSVHSNILSGLKLCVGIVHCFFLNVVLIHESISCISDSPED